MTKKTNIANDVFAAGERLTILQCLTDAFNIGKTYTNRGDLSPWSHIFLSLYFIRNGNAEEVLRSLKEAQLKCRKTDVYFHYYMGEAYRNNLQYETAINYFKKALKPGSRSDPWFVTECLNRIACISLELGRTDEALIAWKKILNKDPDNKEAIKGLHIYREDWMNFKRSKKIIDAIDMFAESQKIKYLKKNSLKKFSSVIEENNFLEKVVDAWKLEVSADMIIIDKFPEAVKKSWIEKIEINFSSRTCSRKKLLSVSATKINSRFPFLPACGIAEVFMARQSLISAGIPESRLWNFITGIEKPDDHEIALLKWAYKVGRNFIVCSKMTGKERDAGFGMWKGLILQRLNKDDYSLCFAKMLEQECGDFD